MIRSSLVGNDCEGTYVAEEVGVGNAVVDAAAALAPFKGEAARGCVGCAAVDDHARGGYADGVNQVVAM